MRLAELEREFQAYVLGGDSALPEHIRGGAHAAKPVMLGVYRHAYWSRLAEVLQGDFPKLHRLLGDDDFDTMARAYLARHPSPQWSARWVGDRLAEFLADTDPFRAQPALAAMARFEWAQTLAFDAADRPLAGAEDMSAIPPSAWPGMRFRLHASVQRPALPASIVEAWERLERGEAAPPPADLHETGPWIVWRDGFAVRFRRLPEDEAQALELAASDAEFATICELLVGHAGEERAAGRAAEILQGWIGTGVLGELVFEPDSPR
jgi:hypothetical protein